MEFTENELKVLYHFVDNGHRRTSYRYYIKDKVSDSHIYRWFSKAEVKEKILEIGSELNVYDTVADKSLIKIISDDEASHKDKISAIKVWNDLRKRTQLSVQLKHSGDIDLKNINDESLEKVVKQILGIDKIINEEEK